MKILLSKSTNNLGQTLSSHTATNQKAHTSSSHNATNQMAYTSSSHNATDQKAHNLRMSPALEDKDVGIDVLHLKPAADCQCGVCPDPVHQRPKLQQERDSQEPRPASTLNVYNS